MKNTGIQTRREANEMLKISEREVPKKTIMPGLKDDQANAEQMVLEKISLRKMKLMQ